jgi:hypothetical protein
MVTHLSDYEVEEHIKFTDVDVRNGPILLKKDFEGGLRATLIFGGHPPGTIDSKIPPR